MKKIYVFVVVLVVALGGFVFGFKYAEQNIKPMEIVKVHTVFKTIEKEIKIEEEQPEIKIEKSVKNNNQNVTIDNEEIKTEIAPAISDNKSKVIETITKEYPDKEIVFVDFEDNYGENYEELCNRADTNKIYVEIDNGIVLDDEGNGEIYNANPDFNYICYSGLGFDKGTEVTTYCVFNPDNNADDDIIARYDFESEDFKG